MRILLVAVDASAAALIEQGARLAGEAQLFLVSEEEATDAAVRDAPAAVVISDKAAAPIRLAQSLAAIDRDTSITILCAPEREDDLRQSLRFSALVTSNTECRSAGNLEQLGVDLVEAAWAAVRRREHRASVAAADARLRSGPETPRLRGEALGRLVESAPIGILTLDASHAVAAWNATAAEIVGAPEAEVLGRPVSDLFDADGRAVLAGLLDTAARSQPPPAPSLLRRLRDGVEQFVEVTAGPTVSQWGEEGHLLVLSDVTARVLAERARRRAEQAQAFLAETGALLDASLDPTETLRRIAELAVPARAELCLIDLLTEDGTIHGVAFAAVDAEVAHAVEDIRRRFPVEADGSHPVARVIRTGRAEVLEEMNEDTYRQIAQGDDHLALIRKLHYHSALVAPLTARGRTQGAISLLYLDPARQYAPEDLAVLTDVARRAALALDNARLYARERRVAETLQRSLLPARLPAVPGVTFAAHYEPGEGDIGGDWYDVIPRDDGRVGCVVGDIVGRGIKAASIMGQLRNAVRVYGLERDGAADVVQAVDRLPDSLSAGEMATLCYALFDPDGHSLELCCAGHPPPLMIAPDGSTRFLMGGRSGPVGVGLEQHHSGVVESFPAGASLLMYTDGLVERRDRPIDDGLAELEAVAGAGADLEPEALVEAVIKVLRPGPSADDVALLVMRADPVTDHLSLSLPAEPQSVRLIRAELRRWLDGRLPAQAAYEVVLACSEACANAVEHAYTLQRGAVVLEASIDDGQLTLTVRDFGKWRPPRPSDRGRGTGIMEATMDSVEVVTGDSGSEVVLRRAIEGPARP